MGYGIPAMVVGYAGRDAEKKNVGQAEVAEFTIAVYMGKDKDPMWVKVSAWNYLAALAEQLVTKGTFLCVPGTLAINEWTDKDGKAHTSLQLDATGITVGPRPDGAQQSRPRPQQQQKQRPQQQRQTRTPAQAEQPQWDDLDQPF